MIILSCFIANMEQDIFLDMFFAFFFAVSENLFTFAAIKGSHWRNLPKVLSRVAVFRDAATFVRKADLPYPWGQILGYTQAESVPVTNFPCKDFVMHKNGKVCKNGRFIDY